MLSSNSLGIKPLPSRSKKAELQNFFTDDDGDALPSPFAPPSRETSRKAQPPPVPPSTNGRKRTKILGLCRPPLLPPP
ncbi:hypothetical protein DM02DRAFT_362502 [Periconia macrospinosa]|uniref:Uncharacterized protein n=1 Tax=Periconia macrospinosa TaxID=97972 RepID=A0A2V1DTE7_9PLEO|nr:hypothetical protein DM02DRAFT_362502 [Periconia macrospinosa]